MKIVAQILIKDGLSLPSGFVAKSPKKCVIFCRMPIDWTDNGKVKWEKYDLFLKNFMEKIGNTAMKMVLNMLSKAQHREFLLPKKKPIRRGKDGKQ